MKSCLVLVLLAASAVVVFGEDIEDDVVVSDVQFSRQTRGTCGYDECNRHCRKLGHARGVCIGNYCQCRMRLKRSAEEPEPKSAITASEVQLSRQTRGTCGYDECNRHCRKLGHARGVCIGNYCQCRMRLKRSAEEPEPESAITASEVQLSRQTRGTCGYDECNRHCRKLGHARGVCIGNYCQCRMRLKRSAEELDPEPSITAIEVQLSRQTRGTCGYDECNRHCRKLGHARGVCIGNYCQCRMRLKRSAEEPEPSVVESPRQIQKRQIVGPPLPGRCTFYICIADCQKKGRRSGYCTINGCVCL